MAGVAKDTLYRVKKILKIGDEETKRRLRAGEISISYAYYSLIAKTESAESIDTVASPVPSNGDSNDSECSNGDSNDTKLLLINKNVKRLIEMVETGDAAPNVIIQELKTLLDMTV